MKRIVVGVALVAVMATTATGTVLGWVDEFCDGHVEAYEVGGANGITYTAASTFDGTLWDRWTQGGGMDVSPRAWDFMGQQGLTGKTNARAKLMFRFNATNPAGSYASLTASINRYRAYPAPPVASSCTGFGTYIGTASQTFDSSAAGDYGQQVNDRLLPVYDFHQEMQAGDVGYRDQIAGVGHGNSQSDYGCFKIRWF